MTNEEKAYLQHSGDGLCGNYRGGLGGCGAKTIIVQSTTENNSEISSENNSVQQQPETSGKSDAGELSKKNSENPTTAATTERATETTAIETTTTTETTTADISESYYEKYSDIIDLYREIKRQGNNHDKFISVDYPFPEFEENFEGTLNFGCVPESFSIKDLDGNGIPELVIFYSPDLYISAIYTYFNGSIRPLAFFGYRTELRADDAGIIYTMDHTGADSYVISSYVISSDGSKLVCTESKHVLSIEKGEYSKDIIYEGQEDFFNGVYNGSVPITEEEFNVIDNAYKNASLSVSVEQL